MTQIEETTVADIDGWMVTVGNVMQGQWRRADGTSCSGLSAEIGLYDDELEPHGEFTVGVGSELQIAGRIWHVKAVVAGEASGNEGMSNGHIALSMVA